MRNLAESLAGLAILVVEDEKFSRHIILRYLSELGCAETLIAEDGAAGLDLLRLHGNRIGCVICDFIMPNVNGIEMLKAIRVGIDGVPRSLPALMLTGHRDHRLVRAAISLDVDAFVIKPVSQSVLASRLDQALHDRQTMKSPEDYAATNIDRLLDGDILPWPGRVQAAEERRVTLKELEPDLTLARDLRGPDGRVVIEAGTVFNARAIRRLQDLPVVGINVSEFWVVGGNKAGGDMVSR